MWKLLCIQFFSEPETALNSNIYYLKGINGASTPPRPAESVPGCVIDSSQVCLLSSQGGGPPFLL